MSNPRHRAYSGFGRDAPPGYGPHQTIYNRFIRWTRLGVFSTIFAALVRKGAKPEGIMIDATASKRLAICGAATEGRGRFS